MTDDILKHIMDYEDRQFLSSFDSASSTSSVDLKQLITSIRMLKASRKEQLTQTLREFMAEHGFDLDAGDKLFVPDDLLFGNRWLGRDKDIPDAIETMQFLPDDMCYLVKMSVINEFRFAAWEKLKDDLLWR